MGLRDLLRFSVPLIIVIAVLTAQSYLYPSSLALVVGDRTAGDHSFRDLTDLFPEGIERLTAAASWDSGAILIGLSSTGEPALAHYDVSRDNLSEPFLHLPDYFSPPELVARLGSYYLLAGDSLGTSPVLGLYDAVSTQFIDVTGALPSDVDRVVTLSSASGSFFMVLENDTALLPASFNPGSRSLGVMEVEGFENVTRVRHSVWNGTASYLVGEWMDGSPALVAITPMNSSLLDLSDSLPGDMDRVDHLIWARDSLYILGVRNIFWNTRASFAVFNTSSQAMTSLSSLLRSDYTSLQSGAWNGTALSLMPQIGTSRTLMAYYPDSDSSVFLDGVIPSRPSYLTMVPFGEDIILPGNDELPVLGLVRTSTWEWDDREKTFDGTYRMIYDVETTDSGFAIGGVRQQSAALGMVDVNAPSLEDESDYLDLEDATIYGSAWGMNELLLAGGNESGGILYVFDPSSGLVENLTSEMPGDVDYLYDPIWGQSAYLIPGYSDGKAVVLTYDPQEGVMSDLSRQVQSYFASVFRAVAHEDLFVLLGYNDRGAALATLNAETGVVDYLGNELSDLYGSDAFLMDAAYNGEYFLVGGLAGGEALIGAWYPALEVFKDLSWKAPKGFGVVYEVVWTGDDFVLGGGGTGSASMGIYHPANETFADLSSILTPSSTLVTSMAVREGKVLVVSTIDYSRPSMGLLTIGEASSILDSLPSIIRDPANAAILALSIALAAVLAHILGRHGRRPAVALPVPPPPGYTVGPPEDHAQEYSQEYFEEY